MNDPASVQIHGDMWKLADVVDEIQWCRGQEGWQRRVWHARPALIDKYHVSSYVGQKYDPDKIRLDPTGWTHDHCVVCQWTITESDDPAVGEGYSCDGHAWVCIECYENLVLGEIARDVP